MLGIKIIGTAADSKRDELIEACQKVTEMLEEGGIAGMVLIGENGDYGCEQEFKNVVAEELLRK